MDQMKKNMSLDRKAADGIMKMLDRGIDDMESRREMPLMEAFRKVKELRSIRRDARL